MLLRERRSTFGLRKVQVTLRLIEVVRKRAGLRSNLTRDILQPLVERRLTDFDASSHRVNYLELLGRIILRRFEGRGRLIFRFHRDHSCGGRVTAQHETSRVPLREERVGYLEVGPMRRILGRQRGSEFPLYRDRVAVASLVSFRALP